jgi:hypothetical protein
MDDLSSIYDQLSELALILRDPKPTKGETILRARQALDTILSELYRDEQEGERYIPGVSVIVNPDDEDNEPLEPTSLP